MAFSQALSGLTAASTDLNVVSNNISNSQTVGFKSSSAQFSDVYSGAEVGLGTTVSGVVQNFESGSLTTTDNELDLAISGSGFFVLTDGTETVYSRNGQLTLTADGYLENAAGYQLVGTTGVIQIPTTGMAASATTTLDAELNLDASEDIITTTFSQTDSSTYNYSTTATVYDSLGISHTTTLYFTKTAENTWDVHTAIDGNLLSETQTVEFSSSGLITSGASGTYTYDPDNGAAALSITLDLTGTTQFGSDSAASDISQNGYTSGSLVSFTIDDTGTVIATYSNDQTKNIAQIQLATFANESGLESNGDNTWLATSASGQAVLGVAGSGSVGTILSGTTEDSNVDLTAELVNLIIAQRNFQANAKAVTAQSEVLQQSVNIGQ